MPSSNEDQLKKLISQAVQDLVNSPPVVAVQPVIHCDDIYPTLRPYFTAEAAKALHNKSLNQLHQYNDEVGHLGLAELLSKLKIKSAKKAIDSGLAGYVRRAVVCSYFGGACEYRNVGRVAMKLINMINDLASKNFIKATLSPLSIIKLAIGNPYDKQKYVLVSYIHLLPEADQYVKDHYSDLSIQESEMPREFGDDE
jgi:hypothetical protein